MTFSTVLSSWSTVPTWHLYTTRGGHCVALGQAAEQAGAHIYTETPAKQLLMDENGAVAGVIATDKSGKNIQFNAKGVIMCSGGYPCNREMINTYSGWNFISPEEESLETGYTSWKGTPGRDGDGILMGMAAGGDTFRLGAVMADFSEVAGTRVEEAHPSRCLMGVVPTLWVNESAKRFTSEGLVESFVAYGESRATQIESYNILDSEFLKDPKYLIPVKTAPFYGVKTIPIFMTTVGGLRVDERMRVLTPEGKAITGLYACGSDAGGLYGYEYDVLVAAGSQQSFAAVGARFAIDDFVECVIGDGYGYVPAGPDLME